MTHRLLTVPLVCLCLWCAAECRAADVSLDTAALIARAFKEADGVAHLENRAVALERIARVHLQGGRYDETLKILAAIAEPYPRALSLIRLGDWCAANGRPEQAADLFKRAVAVIDRVPEPDARVAAWLALAETASDLPDHRETGIQALENAVRHLDRIRDSQMRSGRMRAAAEGYLAYGENPKALDLLEKALEEAEKIKDAQDRITVLDGIALAFVKAGLPEKAAEITDEIEELYTRSATPDRLVDFHAAAGRFDAAAESARAIERPHTRAFAFCRLAFSRWRSGDGQGAEKDLALALEAAKEVDDLFLRSGAVSQVALSRVAMGEPEKAYEMRDAIEDPVVRDAALEVMAVAFGEKGLDEKAGDVAAGIRESFYRASAFHGLAVLFLEKGDPEKALARLELSRTAARDIEDRHNRFAVRVNIADALAAAGAFDEAVKTAKGIEDPYHRETALYRIAREYTRKKRYPEAVQAADRVSDPYYRASALTEIVEAVAAGGK